MPICTASKCGQKLYCYARFGNTDVKLVVQHLFLVEMIVVVIVVADRSDGRSLGLVVLFLQ